MNWTIFTAMGIATLLLAASAPAQPPQEDRELDAELEGVATKNEDGSTAMVSLEVSGTVIVTEPEQGVSRTAYTQGPTVTAVVDLDGVGTFTVPVTVGGEGVSLVQTGVTVDGWNLHFQGTSLPEPGPGATIAQLQGSLTLIGNDDAGYLASGEGTLSIPSGADTTSYALSYTGTATFA